MKIAIVDDDINIYENLKICLDEYLTCSYELEYFKNGEEFLAVWRLGMFDIIILDIFMDKLTGMDVARQIRKSDRDVKIVFSTTSNEFASESYEVDACYYLHKPYGRERVKNMLDRLDLEEVERMRTAKLPDGTSVVIRDVIFADFASHKVTLHCKQNKNIVVRLNFSEIEPILCAHPCFFSPTKGIIVNFYEVTAQCKDTFKMSDGSIIPISRRKTKEVLDAYSAFLFRQLRRGDRV